MDGTAITNTNVALGTLGVKEVRIKGDEILMPFIESLLFLTFRTLAMPCPISCAQLLRVYLFLLDKHLFRLVKVGINSTIPIPTIVLFVVVSGRLLQCRLLQNILLPLLAATHLSPQGAQRTRLPNDLNLHNSNVAASHVPKL